MGLPLLLLQAQRLLQLLHSDRWHTRQRPIVPREQQATLLPRLDMWSNFEGSSAKCSTTTNQHEEMRQVELRIVISDGMDRRVTYESSSLLS